MGKNSDVSGAEKEDHAVFAAQVLRDAGLAQEWEVVVADDYHLQLDFDSPVIPDIFGERLNLLDKYLSGVVESYVQSDFKQYVSMGGNRHVVVKLPFPILVMERVAWQLLLGSDPRREFGHLISIERGEKNPILLFMRKDRDQI